MASIHDTPTEELPLWTVPHVAAGEPRDAARRLAELERAIARHEAVTSHVSVPKRPGDHALYRRLRAIRDGFPG